ncbi:hypothetical protein NIASO_20045 [Niabella soli DSM 19437]|uniref:Uncharacterized protein n=1 Tax=Niabella soli DSM 19437 TaxID=929713 RepID=W0F9D1_9BACT|nr:hypothetical protein NIASO_20045 [Niabella soli DSM 19437]
MSCAGSYTRDKNIFSRTIRCIVNQVGVAKSKKQTNEK